MPRSLRLIPESRPKPEFVIVDHEISPSQTRNLERATGAQVLDRTGGRTPGVSKNGAPHSEFETSPAYFPQQVSCRPPAATRWAWYTISRREAGP